MADATMAGRLRPGDHVCWTYADDAERRRITAACVRAGLRDRHKVLWCTLDLEPAAALAELEDAGIRTSAAVRAGRLTVMTAASSYLVSGSFDAEATCRIWPDEFRRARREGYAGMRVLGDMSWAGGTTPGADRVGWYELQVNHILADGYALGICLYDRRRFTGDTLATLCRAHPVTLSERSSAREPLLRIIRTRAGLRLSGEADVSNRDALATMLGAAIDEPADRPVVALDLSELCFADAATGKLIVDAGRRAGGRLRITAARPPVHRLLAQFGGEAVPGLLSC
jgi:anti-anti-sigma regulatory factor